MGRKKKIKKTKIVKKKKEKKINLPIKSTSADQKIEIKKQYLDLYKVYLLAQSLL